MSSHILQLLIFFTWNQLHRLLISMRIFAQVPADKYEKLRLLRVKFIVLNSCIRSTPYTSLDSHTAGPSKSGMWNTRVLNILYRTGLHVPVGICKSVSQIFK